MDCLLCLNINENGQDSIIYNSIKWQELNIQYVVEKYLWKLEHLTNSSNICQSCWQELYNFHNFYLKIEKAHTNLNILIKSEVVSNDVSSEEKDKPENNFGDSEENSQLEPEILLLKVENPLEIFENDVEEVISLKNTAKRKRPLRKNRNVKKHIEKNYSKKRFKNEKGNSETTKPEADKNRNEIDIKLEELENDSKETKLDENFNDQNNTSESDGDPSANDNDSSNLEQLRQKRDKFIAENLQITCSLCQIPLGTFALLTQHYKEEHNQRGYTICCDQKLYARTEIVDHIKLHKNPEYFKCKYCDKIPSSRTLLKLHIKNVHEQKNVECDICGKILSSETTLKRHKLLHDADNVEKIPCKQCDKSYLSKESLNNHIRLVHLKKHIICDLCGKSLKDNYTFKLHMLEHEGKEKSKVSCEVCGRILSDVPCLKRHMRSNHPPNGVKPELNCPVCTKIFTSTSNLKTHIKSVHENKYVRKCTLCEKTFKKPGALKDHMANHAGNPLRACGFCPKTFYSSGNMHAHRKRAHPIEWQESIREKFSGNLPENYATKTM